jgi:predicted PurR-regulated permease PerM
VAIWGVKRRGMYMSVQVSVGIIAICILVLTFATFIATLVLALLGLRVSRSIATLTNRVQPLVTQATETAKTVNSMAQTVKAHADGIMSKAEDTVDNVAQKVKLTSNIVQESISPPLITAASVITGLSRGLEVLSQLRKRGGNGHARREP